MSDFMEIFAQVPQKTIITINIENDNLKYLEMLQEKTNLSRSTIINIIVQQFKKENENINKETKKHE